MIFFFLFLSIAISLSSASVLFQTTRAGTIATRQKKKKIQNNYEKENILKWILKQITFFVAFVPSFNSRSFSKWTYVFDWIENGNENEHNNNKKAGDLIN